MFVSVVTVFVKPKHIQDFIAATRENHQSSVQEPGNLRFDVLQCTQDPTRFLLYEAYLSEEAAAAHKQTPHYLAWKEKVGAWMAQPREGVPHRVLFPDQPDQW